MKPQYVYVIGWRPRGPCKVGKATNLIDRLSGLQTGNPERLKVFYAVHVATLKLAYLVEANALLRLNQERLVGEWSDVTAKVGKAAVQAAYRQEVGSEPVQWHPTEIESLGRELQLLKQQDSETKGARAAKHLAREIQLKGLPTRARSQSERWWKHRKADGHA